MSARLAIDGGVPVRSAMLPYGRQSVSDEDVAAVEHALRSPYLTTGPEVDAFERAFAEQTGTRHAVAVSSGTAALHCMYFAAGIRAGDEVIVPAMTFAATANAALYLGARPIFADVCADTLLIDPVSVRNLISPRTKAVVAVDYAGQPCDYEALNSLCAAHNITLLADACHSLGGAYNGEPVGSLAGMSAFSLHPVKPITAGEGGVVTVDNEQAAATMRRFRSHGISTDARQREEQGSWFYEMVELGNNYRITDFQCALAHSQLSRLDAYTDRRRAISRQYNAALAGCRYLTSLAVAGNVGHAYHLYVIRLNASSLTVDRGAIFRALRAEGIGVNVHYIPVHLHPYYRDLGWHPGQCPVSEAAYENILSLPIFPAMTDADASDVIDAVRKVCEAYGA